MAPLPHYAGGGVPTLLVTWRLAEFQRPEILDRPDGRIYIATGEVLGIRGKDAGRGYQDSTAYSLMGRKFFQARHVSYIEDGIFPDSGA